MNLLSNHAHHGWYSCTCVRDMSVDHSVVPFQRPEGELAPVFLSVKAGMTVICGSTDSDDWWMADVIYVDGGARDPKVPTLFQVADVARELCAGSALTL